MHGNRDRKPANTIDKSISEDIILLYTTKYQGFNFQHFKDFLEKDENIHVSYYFIYKTLMKADLTSPRIRKATRKEIANKKIREKKENTNKSNEEIEELVNKEICLEDAHPRQERPKNFGELTEMDASSHVWFGDTKSHLHLSADKCTNTIVGAYFDWQETLFGYYNVLKQILENYGIPYKFKTDNRTVFNYLSTNPDKRTAEKDVLTQFGYACKQLGVSLETTSVSQAKGLIEHDNGTFQDRLTNELRLKGITTIEAANEYLINTFVPEFNKKFARNYKDFNSVYETAPEASKINCILAILAPRKFDNGSSIKYKNEYYQAYENGVLKCFKSHTECLVIKAFDNNLFVTVGDKIYELRKLQSHAKYSVEFDFDVEKEEVQTKTIIPEMNNLLKLEEFQEQLEKAHEKRIYA